MVGHPLLLPSSRGRHDEEYHFAGTRESPPFYEGLDGILEVDAVFGQVAVAPVILTIFAPAHPGFGRSWSGTFDAAIFKVCTCTLR